MGPRAEHLFESTIFSNNLMCFMTVYSSFLLVCETFFNRNIGHIGWLWNAFPYAFKFFTEVSNHVEMEHSRSSRWFPRGLSVAWCGCLEHRQQTGVLFWKPTSLSFLLQRISTDSTVREIAKGSGFISLQWDTHTRNCQEQKFTVKGMNLSWHCGIRRWPVLQVLAFLDFLM